MFVTKQHDREKTPLETTPLPVSFDARIPPVGSTGSGTGSAAANSSTVKFILSLNSCVNAPVWKLVTTAA